jgi:EmrB/QacA subfamily drug resistance transporter
MTTTAEPTAIDPRVLERRWLILATMCLSLVLVVATVSSVNVAIPSMARELKPSDTQILWIVDAYALVFAGLLLFSGSLGDRFGRKGALQIGLAVFAAASIVCGLADSPSLLIGMRAVMGVGAALVMPSTLSLVVSSFPAQERPKAIAIWVGFAGAGASIGPIMGGFLVTHFWWGSVFFVPTILALITLVGASVVAPTAREPGRPRLDPVGALLSIVGFSSFLFAIIEGPEKGWTDALVITGFVVAALGLGGFVGWERRTPAPMLDMHYFSDRRFAAGTVGITISFFAMFSLFFGLTQYLQYVRGYSPLLAGCSTLPNAIALITISPRSTTISGRIGAKTTVVLGLTLVAVGLSAISFLEHSTPYPVIAACLLVVGSGMALNMPTLSSGIVTALPMHKAGVASAVNDTTREVGGATGIAVVGSVVSAVYRSHAKSALATLPPDAAREAHKNVGRATGVAERMAASGGDGRALLTAVREAFVDGFHTGLRISAALVLVGAAFVAWRLPRTIKADGHSA